MRRALARQHEGSPALTAIPRDEGTAIIESRQRDHAVIAAARAALHFIRIRQRLQFLRCHKRGHMPRRTGIPRDERHAIRPHQPRHIRTDDLSSEEQLQRAKHRIIIEGPALHHDPLAQVRRLLQADDLVERILDDRVGETRRNICDRDAILLCLPHTGIHEDRAARAQIHRMLCRESDLGEMPDIHPQRPGKGIKERPAARRAGLIEKDIIHRTILDAAALHILPSDIKDRRDIGEEMLRTAIVRHRLHFPDIRLKRPLDELLAIACHTRSGDRHALRELGIQILQDPARTRKRRPLISSIVLIEDAILLIEQYRLDRRRARIDAEPDRALRRRNIAPRHAEMTVPLLECLVVRLSLKKRGKRLRCAKADILLLFHAREPAVKIHRLVMHRRQRRPDRHIELPVTRDDHILICDVKRLLKALAKHRLIRQRTA